MYRRIFAELATKPVPVIVVDTVVLTVPLVGDIDVTVDDVALLTVNERVIVPPSEFRMTRVQVPEAIPFRLKFLLRVVAVSVPTATPVTVDCPVCVRVTVAPLIKPVPTTSMVCEPLLLALAGVTLVIVGVDAEEVPVAVKVTGEPTRDPLVAVIVFDPAVVPRVQLPTVATPFEPVVADKPVAEPPPENTTKVTPSPLFGLLYASFTITLGNVVTAVPTGADWLVAEFAAIWVAVPAVPVAVNVTPVTVSAVASNVFDPAVVPRVQLPTVATPFSLVVCVAPVMVPPPEVMVKVTKTPVLTGV